MNQKISRRSALRKVTGGTIVMAVAGRLSHRLQVADEASAPALKGRIHHSVLVDRRAPLAEIDSWHHGGLNE
jgi:hypothetical protein